MAAEGDLVLRLLREICSQLSTQGSRMEAIKRQMDTIQQHIEDIEASVARAVLEARIEFLEKS